MRAERRAGEDLLSELIGLLSPRRLVPIGNDAAATALRLYRPQQVVKVRHPSYGGQKTFLQQIRELYGGSGGSSADLIKVELIEKGGVPDKLECFACCIEKEGEYNSSMNDRAREGVWRNCHVVPIENSQSDTLSCPLTQGRRDK